ncbi:hypothetical protein K469DRAFT_706820 [Zopfia rhizophila CBS 207.26]|uniref:F-box domain-containing protein n=1 Tax=Zopfia rhizophila CBS 207.26 TaxID=1314779 RepID=A0A6A6E7L9_9PEZI|nr:hypothetical protein K469DRAFT_706820 [Zopfia rhizophila CBS 207.26]
MEYTPGRRITLLSLVDELLLCIIEHIDTQEALVNLATTCSRFQGLTEPFVWRSVLVRKGSHAREITNTLMKRPERASFIHDLAIRYASMHEKGIQDLNLVLPHLNKLRHLTIESPCPNNGPWRTGGVEFTSQTRIDYTSLLEASIDPQLKPPRLSMLQSLTLHGHGHGDNKFTFGRNAVIFLHPSLRNLTISCSNFAADITPDDIPQEMQKSTPLTSLTFIECNVSVELLDIVLGFPRALKELSIGERLFAFPGCFPKTTLGVEQSRFLRALSKQGDSLELLRHIGGYSRLWPPSPADYPNFRSLKNLRRLELGFESTLRHYLHVCNAPESLKSLKMYDGGLVNIRNVSTLQHLQFVWSSSTELALLRIPKTCAFEVCFTHHGPTDARPVEDIPPVWRAQTQRNGVYNIAKPLKARGGRFRIFGQEFPTRNKTFIPPYMYGEDLPIETLLYDSEELWKFAGVNYRSLDAEEGLLNKESSSTGS